MDMVCGGPRMRRLVDGIRKPWDAMRKAWNVIEKA